MVWLQRRSTPWIVMALHAIAGSMAIGLIYAAWSVGRSGIGLRCWLTGCLATTTATTLFVVGSYFTASMLSAIPLGLAEWTGAEGNATRTGLAVLGPPALFAVLTWTIG